MAFTIDRVEAARRLSVSTRTIDRHINAGKIRTKRIGKKMFLEEDDVDQLRSLQTGEEYVVYDTVEPMLDESVEFIHRGRQVATVDHDLPNFRELFEDAQSIIRKKDEIIQDLSYRLGKSETELKGSIPLIEYNKTNFLLESAKTKGEEDLQSLRTQVGMMNVEIRKKNSAILIFATLLVLVLLFSGVFLLYTKMMM